MALSYRLRCFSRRADPSSSGIVRIGGADASGLVMSVRARFLDRIWSATDEHAEARFEATQREHGLCLSHLARKIRHIVHEFSLSCV